MDIIWQDSHAHASLWLVDDAVDAFQLDDEDLSSVFTRHREVIDRIDFRYDRDKNGSIIWKLQEFQPQRFFSDDYKDTVLLSHEKDKVLQHWWRGKKMANYLDQLRLIRMPKGLKGYFNCYKGAAACVHAMQLSEQLEGLRMK